MTCSGGGGGGHHTSPCSKVSASSILNGRRHESKMRDNYTNTGQRVTGVPATSLVLLLHLKKKNASGWKLELMMRNLCKSSKFTQN